MRIAIEGCCHGALDAIYAHIHNLERRNGYIVDLLLICGDFQAVRNHGDLECMAVPDKYKELGQFYKYYTGEKTAPILTIVIGGNHEASNYMQELYHGGWLAPNIYFLGQAGCVRVNGLRIAGASGIFKGHDFRSGQHETLPYDKNTMRSIYHIREFNVRRLSLLSKPNIFLSHDWPLMITDYGDVEALLSRKRFLRDDIANQRLGSPPLMGLLQTLKPDWWFSAHLHTRFEARVSHGPVQPSPVQAGTEASTTIPAGGRDPNEIAIDFDEDDDSSPEKRHHVDGSAPAKVDNEYTADSLPIDEKTSVPHNPDEIMLDDEIESVAPVPVATSSTSSTQAGETRFLALDKCLPRREFLEVIHMDASTDGQNADGPRAILTFDPEWLAIMRAFNPWFSTEKQQMPFPPEQDARDLVRKELEWVREHVRQKFGGKPEDEWLVPECQQFVPTAPGGSNIDGGKPRNQPPWYPNPQTDAICRLLEMENKIDQHRSNAMGSSSSHRR